MWLGAEVAPWIDSRERTFRPGKSGPRGRWAQSEDELLLVEEAELDESELDDELEDSELDDELEEDDAVEDELDDDPWSFL